MSCCEKSKIEITSNFNIDLLHGKNATREFHVICFHVKFTCMPQVNFTYIVYTHEFYVYGCTCEIHVYAQTCEIQMNWSHT